MKHKLLILLLGIVFISACANPHITLQNTNTTTTINDSIWNQSGTDIFYYDYTIYKNGYVGMNCTSSKAPYCWNNTVSMFRNTLGASSVTPGSCVISQPGGSGKYACLIAGTGGSSFLFDNTAFFTISSASKSSVLDDTVGGSSTQHLRIDSSNGQITLGTSTQTGKIRMDYSASGDGGIFYTASDRTIGNVAGNSAFSTVPYWGMRGNTYSAIANQRGLLFFNADGVSSPSNNEMEMRFMIDETRVITIENNKKVGIGVNANNADQTLMVTGNASFKDYGNSATTLFIDSSNDKIGILTDTPNQELQVIGNINVSGTIYYGALQANSPHTFINKNGDQRTEICVVDNNLNPVLMYLDEIGGVYNWVFVKNSVICKQKILTRLETTGFIEEQYEEQLLNGTLINKTRKIKIKTKKEKKPFN